MNTINIDIKDYDVASYGIRVFDDSLGFGDINDLVAELEVNGDPNKVLNKQEIAIAMALERLAEKHKKELVDLYMTAIKEIENE